MQRLKGFNLDFLDSKIAEEQAKQAKQSPSRDTKRTPSRTGQRGVGQTGSPGKKAGNRLRIPDSAESTGQGPDPEEFIIGDDASDLSRSITPAPVTEAGEGPLAEQDKTIDAQDATPHTAKGKEKEAEKIKMDQVSGNEELPQDVRKKLAKLETLTARYQGACHAIISLQGNSYYEYLRPAKPIFLQIFYEITGRHMLELQPLSLLRLLFEKTPPLHRSQTLAHWLNFSINAICRVTWSWKS